MTYTRLDLTQICPNRTSVIKKKQSSEFSDIWRVHYDIMIISEQDDPSVVVVWYANSIYTSDIDDRKYKKMSLLLRPF